jgi:hypothetical protein
VNDTRADKKFICGVCGDESLKYGSRGRSMLCICKAFSSVHQGSEILRLAGRGIRKVDIAITRWCTASSSADRSETLEDGAISER